MLLNNENLEADFRVLVASLFNSECATDVELVNGLFQNWRTLVSMSL